MPDQALSQTILVRKGEELNIPLLEEFLHSHVPGLPDGSLEIRQFSAGHSNLTYELSIGNWQAVLRRPPLGPVAPKAHDMQREFFILHEVHPLFGPAPVPILFSENPKITGSPFLLMERKQGVVIDSAFPEGIKVDRKLCRRISSLMVDRLVELHDLDYQKTRLLDISRPEGFMERQVHGWVSRYQKAQTENIQEVEKLTTWLVGHIPAASESSLIHYDFKLNNAMFNESLTEMTGLFDWEMSTVGDPLADLGAAMSYWTEEHDPPLLKTGLGKPPVTVMEGFMTRQQFMEEYAKKSGRDITHMNFYLTFAYFKLAVIAQQIFYRYKKGQTQDPRFAHFDTFVKSLIAHAAEIAG
ncbi:phosphotransferase family protein [Peribacillus kribbensis]|uniref:phosphotransferase family protein n=1 Tax=Peribacillus kribbensis TaxID=356658 RepID=UPI000425D572|nr:phosphotransferase family protein [Peribacillus kribbensis]